ncbi:MAG: hypothetical protein MJ050_06870 [Phascolarctobacterium sp.]|nr:hypothetical protein [Phascolarctobacterium sp.]
MVVKYGILAYDEPKEFKTKIETPKKLSEYKLHDNSDFRSDAVDIAANVYDELKGKDHFRFYIEGGESKSIYQVNFAREGKDFFEEEILDDLNFFNKRKTLIK